MGVSYGALPFIQPQRSWVPDNRFAISGMTNPATGNQGFALNASNLDSR